MTSLTRFVAIAASSLALSLVFTSCTLDELASDLEGNERVRSSSRYGTSNYNVKKKNQKRAYVPEVKKNDLVLAKANKSNTKVVIDIARQKGFLLVNGKIGMETSVSTARSGKYTPRGTFRMTERVRTGKHSTIYGVEMPYWMRLSGTVYGVHAGYLPGYPASAGCVRLPAEAAQVFYDHTGYGTQVSIESSWSQS